ncbi:flavin reductase family protein [Jannaschia sp. R86511]|uniref:flavin reductase family protein n=1 Tax=Jannaschia sp. R86511 TaxID=3093853 RepID=UPI0036D2385E
MTTTPLRGGPAVDLRRAFRLDASSVWVVTSAHEGSPVGFTAVSVASVSISPPLLSFNVSRTSSSLATLLRSGHYAVHLLSHDQEDVARRFAADASRRFADPTTWSWAHDGLPQVHGVVTRVSGAVLRLVDAGDSLLVLGEVHDVLDHGHGTAVPSPLVHHDRTYTRTAAPAAHLAGAVA